MSNQQARAKAAERFVNHVEIYNLTNEEKQWQLFSSCSQTVPEFFDPLPQSGNVHCEEVRIAKSICEQCEMIPYCARFVIKTFKDNNFDSLFGVWAGEYMGMNEYRIPNSTNNGENAKARWERIVERYNSGRPLLEKKAA